MDQENPADHDAAPSHGADSNDADEAQARAARIEQAVANFQAGVEREESFRFLFDTFYGPTRQFLARRVTANEDRLDLTQETFLRVYKGLEGFRGDAQFGTWVFRIAFNTYSKWLRRVKVDEKGGDAPKGTDELEPAWDDDETIAVAPQESPLEQTLRAERREVLHRAIEELPEQMRRCTELRVYHELSYREIAVVTRLSIETVKVHLFQARKKLKKTLDDVDL